MITAIYAHPRDMERAKVLAGHIQSNGDHPWLRNAQMFKAKDLEHCEKVLLLSEDAKIRRPYEAKNIPVEVVAEIPDPQPVPSIEEIEAMSWPQKKSWLKRLTGRAPKNMIEATSAIMQMRNG